jgi:hypothetical protein
MIFYSHTYHSQVVKNSSEVKYNPRYQFGIEGSKVDVCRDIQMWICDMGMEKLLCWRNNVSGSL